MKVKWISRQYSRFDLALTKISRPLIAVNTISNLSVALVVGVWLFGALFLFGFLGILGLGYGLHKSGFFMETMNELFDQQSKELWERQQRYLAATFAKYSRLEDKDLEQELETAKRELNIL